ncbi:sulfur carrier protein ThiS [Bosea sp. 124]|uniref:sulfur carrier protein ThiS n=1 Tax=Bosea sp. 124 TaxID=2135642 RepID=UPI000D3C63CD|nr:sulfur carrier protein ThiS [Bosea sp. 124]PTM38583.1 sulfur carrier protein [Bosea sp. 124]
MTLLLNGQPREIAAATLAEALAELGYAGKVVATAVNGDFVAARQREALRLAEGDRIEVLAPMQGG